MSQHGPWFIKDSSEVYVDPFIKVRVDQVIRPDGNDGQHVVVLMKPGVCVLAIDEDNNIYLTREFHYGVGRYSLEAVSGGRDRQARVSGGIRVDCRKLGSGWLG